jgi:hypothetical protein
LLNDEAAMPKAGDARNRLYDAAVRQALTVSWEAAGRIVQFAQRLRPVWPSSSPVATTALASFASRKGAAAGSK